MLERSYWSSNIIIKDFSLTTLDQRVGERTVVEIVLKEKFSKKNSLSKFRFKIFEKLRDGENDKLVCPNSHQNAALDKCFRERKYKKNC